MTIQELKYKVEKKEPVEDFMIFQYKDSDFLPFQYLHEIRDTLCVDIEWVDNDSELGLHNTSGLFSDSSGSLLRVLVCDNYDFKETHVGPRCIVICKKVNQETPYTIKFPEIEDWQIKDFVYSIFSGIDDKNLDHLISLCSNDLFRLNQEGKKLALFSEDERKYMFEDFMGTFTDLSDYKIFDFTTAILNKDKSTLVRIYKEFSRIDIEPLGVVTLLYNNVRNIIKIQLSSNATAEKCGLKPNQFWAIKKNYCNKFTKEHLLNIFSFITDLDRKLKIGEITTDIMIDYIMCHMFV